MSGFDEFENGGVIDLNPDTNDDNLVLDLDGVDDSMPEFEALPPGVYDCVIEDTTFGRSNNGNNPMISWQFKVIEQPYEGRLLFYHTVLNKDAGLARLKRLLSRICPDVSLSGFKPQAFCEEGIALGRECCVKVRIKMYQGKRRNDVTDVLAPKSTSSFLDGLS
jgi:hypothetical protein